MTACKKIAWIITVTGISLFSFACTCVQNKNPELNKDQPDNTSGSLVEAQDSVLYLLPSPGEMLERLQSAKVKFNPALLSPIGNKDKYIGSKAQSLNLGVYITDMAYSAIFERSSETVKYLESIRSLSNEVGISSSIFEILIERAKNNTGKTDSLLNISNEAYSNMLDFLESGGKENTLALISAGAYIESLYLALQSINKFSEGDPLFTLISEMKYPLENLFERAKNTRNDENIKSIYNYLDQIILIFSRLEYENSKTEISKNENGLLQILGGEKFTLNEKDFVTLKSKIEEIRTSIITY
jgi:hypothetical protein